MFENQARHFVQIRKLHTQILKNVNVSVTEEEAFREFLNEYNALGVELAEFDELKEAKEFYEKAIKNSGFWGQETRNDKQRAVEVSGKGCL